MKYFLAMLLASAASFTALANITLVKDGKTDYVIVLPAKPSPEEKDALADMKEILKQSTGADFKVIPPEEAAQYTKRIFTGFSEPMKAAAGKIPTLQNEQRVYRNVGNDILIYGGGHCGTTFAVYQFLRDKLGFRALHFWGDTILPKHSTLVLEDFSYDKVPSYIYRDILQAQWNIAGCPTSLLAFRRMMMHSNQFDCIQRVTGCHTFSGFIPYGTMMNQRSNPLPPFKDKAYFKTNPEFFGQDKDGKRTDRLALCFSNPGLRRTMTENVYIFLSRHSFQPEENIVADIAQDDIGGRFCHCEECEKLAARYQAPCGAFYDYLIHDASPYFAKKYPNLLIRFLAYGGKEQTEIPPAASALPHGKLPSNLSPFLAYIGGDYSKAWDHPANKEIYDKLSAWGKISEKMFVYYYPTTYSRPLVSYHMFGNVLRTAKDYQLGTRLNIRYLFNDYSTSFFLADIGFYGLQQYLMTSLSNDSALDTEQLVREYTDGIYGAAGQMMRDYFYELENLGEKDPGFLQWNPDPRFANYFTPENLLRWQRNYDAMEKLIADNPNALAHLRCSRINLDLMTLLLWNEMQQSGVKTDTNPDVIFNRFMASAGTAIQKGYDVRHKNHVSPADKERARQIAETRLMDTGRYFYRIAKGGKKLPKEFVSIPEKNIRYVIPAANKDMISFEDEGAFRVALVGTSPKSGTVGYTVIDPTKQYPNVDLRVNVVQNEPYRLYYLGRTKLSRLTEITAPAMPYRTDKMLGGLGGFARACCGHLYDAKDPGREWDVYVSCRFKEDRCFTDRFVLVKVMNPSDKPVAIRHVEKAPQAVAIADAVADANGKADAVAWDKIRPLAPWKESVSGKNAAASPELKIAFDSKYLYLRYAEKDSGGAPEKDLWNNCAEMFFYGDTLYPLLQIGVSPDGRVLCNTYDIRKSSNDTADGVAAEKTSCPGIIQGTIREGMWTWLAAIPLDKLPAFKKGALHANFYRTYSDGKTALAWSPVYGDGYRSALDRFGTIYPGRIVLSGEQILCKQRTPEGTAFMDGNHGWEITAYPPKGLEPSSAYRISAELRCDAPPVEGKFMTRAGAYDEKTKKITGYVGINVSQIRGEPFRRIPFDKPVVLNADTFLYIGGFIPAKTHKGNVYLKSFIIEKTE